jgi:uncharacterized protein YndB with AHSA1/START domain
MSKKHSKSQPVKKSSKPAKAKSGAQKAKPAKAVKKISAKKVVKSSKPAAKKVVAKKVVKKIVLKKTVKPLKKVVKKAITKKVTPKPVRPAGGKAQKLVKVIAKKVVKPVKVVKLPVKPARPAGGKVELKVVKPAKGAKKLDAPEKSVKLAKEEKVVIKVVAKKSEEKEQIKPVKVKPSRSKGGRKPKKKDGDDDEPEIVHDELIEQLIASTKKKKNGPKIPKILKTFVNPMTSLTVAPSENGEKKGAIVPKKEPKGKFELEYVIRTSAGILYEFITTPSGLSEWFADDVNIRDGIFTFFWDGSEQKAKLLGFKDDKFIRLRWMDKPEGTYFEFRIEKDELTGDTSLIIIDFADEVSDMETSKLLWDSQVNKLLGVLGSN